MGLNGFLGSTESMGFRELSGRYRLIGFGDIVLTVVFLGEAGIGKPLGDRDEQRQEE